MKKILQKKGFKEHLGIENINKDKLSTLRKLLNDLYKKAGTPNSYYAIVYLDGDFMGEWLSGKRLPDIENAYNSHVWQVLPDNFKNELKEKLKNLYKSNSDNSKSRPRKILTPAIHSAISTALRNYTIEFVRKIVEEEHFGKLVYAGGDDVLAFVNLKDLFDVIEKLRWAFSGHIKVENNKIVVDLKNVSGFVEKDGLYYLSMGKNATSSAGIAIVHYKEPLQLALKKVFEMEKKAKSNQEKNRFAISLVKRSGEERVCILPWEKEGILTTQVLKYLKDLMNKERERYYFSDRFIQKLKQEFARLEEPSDKLLEAELKRLIERACNPKVRMEKKEIKEVNSKFVEKLMDLYKISQLYLENFVSALEIVSFMNRGV